MELIEEDDVVGNSRARSWCITLYAPPTDPDMAMDPRTVSPEALSTVGEVVYGIFGLETCPTTNRLHLQGYVRFKNAIRFNSLRTMLRDAGFAPRLEMANGSDADNQDYCSKDGDYVEFGVPPSQGKRTDLTRIRRRIEQGQSDLVIAKNHFGSWCRYNDSFKQYRGMLASSAAPQLRNPRIVVIYGPPGSGKSHYIWNMVKDKEHFWKRDCSRWFAGYTGQRVVVFDDFTEEMFSPSDLLAMLDKYPFEVEYKGGSLPFLAEEIYISSNTAPETWYVGHPKDHRFIRWDMQNPLFRRLIDFGKVFRTTDLHVLAVRRLAAGSALGVGVPEPILCQISSSHAPDPVAFRDTMRELYDGSEVYASRSMQLAAGEPPSSGTGADLPKPLRRAVASHGTQLSNTVRKALLVRARSPSKDKEEEDEYVDPTPAKVLVIDLCDDSPVKKKKRYFLPSSSEDSDL